MPLKSENGAAKGQQCGIRTVLRVGEALRTKQIFIHGPVRFEIFTVRLRVVELTEQIHGFIGNLSENEPTCVRYCFLDHPAPGRQIGFALYCLEYSHKKLCQGLGRSADQVIAKDADFYAVEGG